MGARRIVFDALDILLALLPDDAARWREVYKLHTWLLGHALTGVVSLKFDQEQQPVQLQQPYSFMEFMVDCSVMHTHGMVDSVSQRSLRVQLYCGSRFDENEHRSSSATKASKWWWPRPWDARKGRRPANACRAASSGSTPCCMEATTAVPAS